MSSFRVRPLRLCSALSLRIALLFMMHAVATCWGAQISAPVDSRTPAQTETLDAGEADGIKRLIGIYAQSVDTADPAVAAQVWWDSPDVSFIHPLGHEHGFEQIKQNVYTHLMGDTFSERKLNIHDVSVHVMGTPHGLSFTGTS